MFSPRRHQQEIIYLCDTIIAGAPIPNLIICDVIPAGGKSLLPVIAATKLIEAGIIDRIAWIVPRLTLKEQAALAFLESQGYLNHRLEIRESTNDLNPARTTSGFVTTYQALQQDASQTTAQEFLRARYGLIMDEGHHIADNSPTFRAVRRLYEQATIRFMLTGTLQRGDLRPISFLPYRGDGAGMQVNDTDESVVFIRYSLRRALEEKAIIRMLFKHVDGKAKWLDSEGQQQSVETLEDSQDALGVALQTEYAIELLRECLNDWGTHRKRNRQSALLVVCANIIQAKRMLAYLQGQGVESRIATSDDSQQAQANIRAFRRGDIKALVTVAMAYEGMDVPSITHLACLTHIRSRPWILQMLARVWRFDSTSRLPWNEQYAYAYVPDDTEMQLCIDEIRTAMDRANIPNGIEGGGEGTGGDPRQPATIVPLQSVTTDRRSSEFDGEELSVEETEKWARMAESSTLFEGLSPLEMKRTWLKMQEAAAQPKQEEKPAARTMPPTTAGQRETSLRSAIDRHIRIYEGQNLETRPWGTCNKELIRAGWQPRDLLDEEQLLRLLTYVKDRYPLQGS